MGLLKRSGRKNKASLKDRLRMWDYTLAMLYQGSTVIDPRDNLGPGSIEKDFASINSS